MIGGCPSPSGPRLHIASDVPITAEQLEALYEASRGFTVKASGFLRNLNARTIQKYRDGANDAVGAKNTSHGVLNGFEKSLLLPEPADVRDKIVLLAKEEATLYYVAQGFTSEALCEETGWELEAVKEYRKGYLRKLEVKNSPHAVRIGVVGEVIPLADGHVLPKPLETGIGAAALTLATVTEITEVANQNGHSSLHSVDTQPGVA